MTGPRVDPNAVVFPQGGQGNLVFAPQPEQPANYDQASGNIIQLPGALDAVQNALASVANFHTNKQNESLKSLARIKGLVDAGIMPQEIFSHPEVQDLFQHAGITAVQGTPVMPKIADIKTQQEATQLQQMSPEAQRKQYGITPNTVAKPQEAAAAAIAGGDQTVAEAIQKRIKTDPTFQRDVQEAQMGTSNIRIERIRAAAEVEAAKERAGAAGAGKNYRLLVLYGTLYDNAQKEYAAALKDYNDSRDKQVGAEYSQWQLAHGSQAMQINPKTNRTYGEDVKAELMKTYDTLHGGPPSVETSMNNARETLRRLTGATEEEIQGALRLASDLPETPPKGGKAAPKTPAAATPTGAAPAAGAPAADISQVKSDMLKAIGNGTMTVEQARTLIQNSKNTPEDKQALLDALPATQSTTPTPAVKPQRYDKP